MSLIVVHLGATINYTQTRHGLPSTISNWSQKAHWVNSPLTSHQLQGIVYHQPFTIDHRKQSEQPTNLYTTYKAWFIINNLQKAEPNSSYAQRVNYKAPSTTNCTLQVNKCLTDMPKTIEIMSIDRIPPFLPVLYPVCNSNNENRFLVSPQGIRRFFLPASVWVHCFE